MMMVDIKVDPSDIYPLTSISSSSRARPAHYEPKDATKADKTSGLV
jgi:hypothetical protein